MWRSCNFHLSRNVLLLIFFHRLKRQGIFSACETDKKTDSGGIWPPGESADLWPGRPPRQLSDCPSQREAPAAGWVRKQLWTSQSWFLFSEIPVWATDCPLLHPRSPNAPSTQTRLQRLLYAVTQSQRERRGSPGTNDGRRRLPPGTWGDTTGVRYLLLFLIVAKCIYII